MTNLKGKTAVVTGSTSGIGLDLCPRLRRRRRQCRDQWAWHAAEIDKERSGIEAEFKVKAVYSSADMTKPAEIAGMIDWAKQPSARSMSSLTTPGIQFVAPIEDFPIENGTRSSPSICRRPSMPSAPPCLA